MANPQYIFTMTNLRKVVPPGREILKGIYLAFFPGAKIGVLGANGAGKSSLLRIMAGVDPDFQGEARPADGIRVGYPAAGALARCVQGRAGQRDGGVASQSRAARGVRSDLRPVRRADVRRRDEPAAGAAGELQERIETLGLWDLDRKIDIAMDALRLPPGEADVSTLSGGERRRVALCRVLLEQPDLLLLDEPTNHLDAESVAWLERHLQEFPGTIVAVTHDRYFLDNVAGWILELDRGEGIPWKGNYSSWLEQKQHRLAAEEKQASARQKTLERELDWIRMAPRARHAKQQGAASRHTRSSAPRERSNRKAPPRF